MSSKNEFEYIFLAFFLPFIIGIILLFSFFTFNSGRHKPFTDEDRAREIAKCKVNEKISIFTGTIKEISFYLSHSERSGKSTYTVPDKWWLRVCITDEQGECRTVKITNAPWTWQAVGNKVDLINEYRCDSYGWGRWTDTVIKPHVPN